MTQLQIQTLAEMVLVHNELIASLAATVSNIVEQAAQPGDYRIHSGIEQLQALIANRGPAVANFRKLFDLPPVTKEGES